MAYPTKDSFTFDHEAQGTYPDWTPEESKANLNKRSEEMRVALNNLVAILNSTGEDNWLYQQIANAILDQVADGSLTDIKLSDAAGDIKTRFSDFITSTNDSFAQTNGLIDDVKELLTRNSYDDYQLWLELYYKGTISQVEAENAKAIVFDGFMDTDNIDTVNSTVTIDIVNKKTMLKDIDILLKTGNSLVGIQGNNRLAQVFTVKGTSKLKSIVIPMNNTVSATVKLRIVNTDTYGVPMMENIVYNDVEFYVNSTNYSYVVDLTDLTLTEGVKYAVVFSTTYNTQESVRFYYGGITYEEGSSYYSSDGGNTWNNNNSSMRSEFVFDYISPSTLISDTKSIPFTPTSVKLYQSVKKPVGTSVTTTLSADGGTNYETPTLTTSRVDPKFPDYTEEVYDLTITNVGQDIILKSVLTGSNRDEVEIKRYGLIIS